MLGQELFQEELEIDTHEKSHQGHSVKPGESVKGPGGGRL